MLRGSCFRGISALTPPRGLTYTFNLRIVRHDVCLASVFIRSARKRRPSVRRRPVDRAHCLVPVNIPITYSLFGVWTATRHAMWPPRRRSLRPSSDRLTDGRRVAMRTRSITASVDALPSTHRHYCLLYTSPSPRDRQKSRMPSSA